VSRVRFIARAPSEWPDLWRRDREATVFHHPRWIDAITRAYPRFEPRFAVHEHDGRVDGVLPFVRYRKLGMEQILSLPYGTYGGSVVDPQAAGDPAGALAAAFARLVRRPLVVRFEMTLFHPGEDRAASVDRELGRFLRPTHTHVVDLTVGFDELWNRRYDKDTRTAVRKAEREGVTAAAEPGDEAVVVLARLHAEQSRNWAGFRPHPVEALRAVRETLGEEAEIWVARRGGEPLVAMLVVSAGGREAFAWVSGSQPEARPVNALHLIFDRLFRRACEQGMVRLNFGGSAGNPGIEAFKMSLGGIEVPVRRYYGEAAWRRRLRRS
jgi:CelD/BcsL family acetyltransferase involved in cellulose biosynthesis